MSVFGKAKFGGNKRNWFKLKDGEATFRILPPMGDLQEEGRWSVYYKIHYGYKNSEGKMRTFESPEEKNRKTGMIEVRDAALDRINDLKAKLDEAKEAKNEELVKKLLTFVGGKKSRYNLDSNHYMNVVDLQGNVGILKIRHRAWLALTAVIKSLRDRGIEPLDPESGRYFTFSRSGSGMETVYQVTVYKKRITVKDVGEVEQDVIHVIDKELEKRLIVQKEDGSFQYKEAARLDRLFKKPTSEEVARIVREGDKAVDEILDAKTSGAEQQDEDDSGIEGEDDAPATTASTSKVSSMADTEALLASTGLVANTAAPATAVLATPAPVTVAVQAAPPPAPAPVKASPPPQTTAQALNTQSDADFLKELGLQ